MKRFGRRFGWVFAAALCCALVAVPLHAAETEEAEDSKKVTKESPLVKASREIQAKKTGTAKTYSNEDLAESAPAAKVYTNDDLTRKYGASDEPKATTTAPAGSTAPRTPQDAPDPLALMEQEKKSQADRDANIAAAESALAMAQQKLKSLEVQLLAASNPFSARPKISEEELEKRVTSNEGAAERQKRTQKMFEDARAEVADAEANLSRARAQ